MTTRTMPCLGCGELITQHQDADSFWRPPLCARCQLARDANQAAAAELEQLEASDVVAYDEPLDAGA